MDCLVPVLAVDLQKVHSSSAFQEGGLITLTKQSGIMPSNGFIAVIVPLAVSGLFHHIYWVRAASSSSRFLWPVGVFLPQYRYAKLEQPSQFGGLPCNIHGREEEDCVVPSRYTCDNIPQCEGFLCTHTGTPHDWTAIAFLCLTKAKTLF